MRLKSKSIWNKIKSVSIIIYKVLSVISTLAVFSALLLFIIGKLGFANSSEDDLIMSEIKKQIPNNLTISNITRQDIHGFGNDSLIVLASDKRFQGENRIIANQLLIFDKIENDILNKTYHFFGFGSKYKLTYIFSLEDSIDPNKEYGYMLNLLETVDLTGDGIKELIVSFTSLPSGVSTIYYDVAIFSYDFQTKKYYVLGTYPAYDEKSNAIVDYSIYFPKQNNYYNKDEVFYLGMSNSDDYDFFVDNGYGNVYLIRTSMIWENESHVDPHKHIISVFSPSFNPDLKILSWQQVFSKETTKKIRYCTKDFVFEFLLENEMEYIFRKE